MQANSPRIRASRIASAIVVTVQTTFIGEPDQKLRTLKSPTPVSPSLQIACDRI